MGTLSAVRKNLAANVRRISKSVVGIRPMPPRCANCAGMRLLKATARECLFTSAIVLSEVDAKITMPQTGPSPMQLHSSD